MNLNKKVNTSATDHFKNEVHLQFQSIYRIRIKKVVDNGQLMLYTKRPPACCTIDSRVCMYNIWSQQHSDFTKDDTKYTSLLD